MNMNELILTGVTPTGDLIIPECRTQLVFEGKSRTDKQLSILGAGVSRAVVMLAATKAGKVGKQAREHQAVDAADLIANAAARGNFTPLYEALILNSVKQIAPIVGGAAYENARGFIKGLRNNLKNAGYSNAGKLTAEAKAYDDCIGLFEMCDAAIAARKAADAERRAKEQAKLEQPQGETAEA